MVSESTKNWIWLIVLVAGGYFGWQYYQKSRPACERVAKRWYKICDKYAKHAVSSSFIPTGQMTDGELREHCVAVYTPTDEAQCQRDLDTGDFPTPDQIYDEVEAALQVGRGHEALPPP